YWGAASASWRSAARAPRIARAAARLRVSRSSSSSERDSSSCIAASPPRCSMRIWRCFGAIGWEVYGGGLYARAAMGLAEQLERTNRGMIAFDLLLGTGAALAPSATLRVLGHDEPSPETEELFRRCGPVWLTFAAAHAVAARRGDRRDWWALAWLRGTELLTDILWSRSPGFSRPGARQGLLLAGAANLAMAIGFAALSRGRRCPRF